MNYKTRSGVVMAEICGSRMLIPTRAASAFCPAPLRLSLPVAMIWSSVECGKPDLIPRIVRLFFKLDEDEIPPKCDAILAELCKAGVLVAEEEHE